MALKCRNSKEDIRRQLVEEVARIEGDLIVIMKHVGEQFVADAKTNMKIDPSVFPKGDYTDRTSNLRSSIGYFVVKDRVIIGSMVSGTPEGMKAAQDAMKNCLRNGLQLIVVAGMDYASYVESKGFNVITSQADLAVIDLEKFWKQYAQKRDLLNNLNFNNQ